MSDRPIRTLIPVQGGSGLTPTGAMQFQDDWPGLFIRGDSATSVLTAIRRLQNHCGNIKNHEVAVSLRQLAEIADIIERDVIVRADEPA